MRWSPFICKIIKVRGYKLLFIVFAWNLWNRLWVGTSNGLMQVELETHECKSIKLPEEIKNVFAIAEDKEGNVWIGTDTGLKRLETAWSTN